MKAFIPLLPTLIKTDNNNLKLSVLKAIGVFANLSAVIPIRMAPFYKEIIDSGLVIELCNILKTFDVNKPNTISPIHMVGF
jgi:hypothetical protein